MSDRETKHKVSDMHTKIAELEAARPEESHLKHVWTPHAEDRMGGPTKGTGQPVAVVLARTMGDVRDGFRANPSVMSLRTVHSENPAETTCPCAIRTITATRVQIMEAPLSDGADFQARGGDFIYSLRGWDIDGAVLRCHMTMDGYDHDSVLSALAMMGHPMPQQAVDAALAATRDDA